MDKLKLARFGNLLIAGLMVGNETGGWFVLHPALHTLPTQAHVEAEKAVTKAYGSVMPVVMMLAVLSGTPVLALIGDRRSKAHRYTMLGTLSFIGMLLVTFIGNMPINRRVLGVSPENPPDDWLELRRRWDRFHTLRICLNITGLSLLIVGALTNDSNAEVPQDG